MQKKLSVKMIIFIIIFTLTILFLETKSMAASFSVNATNNTLTEGSTTTLKIVASECVGKFTISSSDSNVVSVNSSSEWIENTTSSITLTAKKAGTATITVTAASVSDLSGDNDVTGSKSVTITVKEQEKSSSSSATSGTTNNSTTKSSDATLKSITVGSKKYTSPNTTITASNVSASTSSIKISAEANSSKAKISGTGTKDLVTGTNQIKITVTAEDGNKKTYTIKITRLAEENQTPNIIDSSSSQSENKKEVELKLTTLEIEGIDISPEFNSEVYEYTANIQDIESLNINAIANDENAKIEITGNENLIEGENIIYIVLTLDEKTVTYKITANKTVGLINTDDEETMINNNEEKVGFIASIGNWWNNGGNFIVLFVITWVMLGIAITCAVIAYKYRKILKEEYGHSFAKDTVGEEYGYDLEEDIAQEKEELDDWYSRPENNTDSELNTKGRHF